MTHGLLRPLGWGGSRRKLFLAAAGLVVVWLAFAGNSARAGTGGVTTTPASNPTGPRPVSGLGLSVDTTWVEGYGYRPVRISVWPTVANPADRWLHIDMRMGQPGRSVGEILVSRDIEIPAGTPVGAKINLIVSFPQCLPNLAWFPWRIDTWEDGQLIEELSAGLNYSSSSGGISSTPLPTVLMILDDDATSIGRQLHALPTLTDDNNQTQNTDVVIWASEDPSKATMPTILQGVAIANLPERWIDYSALDVIYLSLDQFKKLATDRPPQFRAICDWTRAGGNLWVFGAGENWKGIPEIERLLGVPAEKPTDAAPDVVWRRPTAEDYRTVLRQSPPQFVDNDDATATPRKLSEGEKLNFIWRPILQGTIVAIATEPGSANPNWWIPICNALGPDRWQWNLRHGVSFTQNNSSYWNLLIPGVGLPPVLSFCILITLFTLIMGPVNYLFFRRRGKLQLLILTVPLGALLVSAGLITYAFVADGLGVRVRARSFTEIDQRSGEAACWARLSYYAGISPSNGLTFAYDTAVYPFEPDPDDGAHRGLAPVRQVAGETEQHLVSGWLPGRVPTQLITVAARKTKAALKVSEPDGAPPHVENQLGVVVQHLALRASDGQVYRGTNIQPGQSVTLEPATASKPLEDIDAAYFENLPSWPSESYTRGSIGPLRIGRSRGFALQRLGNDTTEPGQAGSRLEAGLDAARTTIGPQSYVAVVERSPEVELGTPDAHEEASFHVIVGHW